MSKQKQQGPDAFDAWYEQHWENRWPSLRQALLAPVSHVAWWNPWTSLHPASVLGPDAVLVERLSGCYQANGLILPQPNEAGLLSHYWLDGASAVCSLLFDGPAPLRVLDLCAAPGGKTLQLLAALDASGALVANEFSKDRYHRLKRVLSTYVPASILEERVRLTRHDACRWCLHEQHAYDWILLDAPCSSERHLLQEPQGLREWSPARSKQLAQRQYTMLVSALEVVRVGGMVVYATCSISPWECDGVMEKLQHKRKDRYMQIPLVVDWAEPTKYGCFILPDRGGWGPLYLSCLQRLA